MNTENPFTLDPSLKSVYFHLDFSDPSSFSLLKNRKKMQFR